MADPLRLLPVLAAAGMLSLTATRLCDAMLPALSRAFSVGTAQSATIISYYAVAYGLSQLLYGPLGDRFDKLRVIGLALFWCTLSSAAAAMAPSLEVLAWARFAMGTGAAAVVPLGIAWIGDQVPLASRQQVLARYSGVTVTGMVIGPLLGGLLTEAVSWRAPFVMLTALFGIMTLFVFRSTRNPAPGMAMTGLNAPPPRPYLQQLRELLASPWARILYAASCCEGLLVFGSLTFLPTVLHERFNLPLMQGGLVMGLFGVGGMIFGQCARFLLPSIPAPRLPGLAGILLCLAFALLAWMPTWQWAAAAGTLAGFSFFVLHNTLQLQATLLSERSRGVAVALFVTTMFIGQSTGAIVGAVLFSRFHPALGFGLAGAGLLLLGLGMMRAMQARAQGARD